MDNTEQNKAKASFNGKKESGSHTASEENNEKSRDKTSKRILSVGASLGIVLVGLSTVVWSLSQVDLELTLKIKK